MRVAVSWSGGKDSCLACYKALAQGHDVTNLVTFIWETPSLAHPMPLIALQSKALGIKHTEARVKEPYFEQYREAMARLKKENGIEGIVTGDISFVDSFHGNWINDVCKGLNIEVIKPLWEADRSDLLNELISKGFKAVFTCVKEPWFDEKWLGRELDWECLKDLKKLRDKYGMDLCGEMGEYHTMMIDGPIFKKALEISRFSKEKQEGIYFMRVTESHLKPKNLG